MNNSCTQNDRLVYITHVPTDYKKLMYTKLFSLNEVPSLLKKIQKNSMIDTTPLCYKCGGHGHYIMVCPSKGFCVEEQESKLTSFSKEKETYNKSELSEKCD